MYCAIAILASFSCMVPNESMRRPNWFRVDACSTALHMLAFIVPDRHAAMPNRPLLRMFMATLKPPPSTARAQWQLCVSDVYQPTVQQYHNSHRLLDRVFMGQLHLIWRINVFQSLPLLVVVIFAQRHMETCRCLGRERWPMDHEVLLFLVLLSGTLCHRPYVYRPLHLDSVRVD